MNRIGFIGLGAMGSGICENLIAKSGTTVMVYDIRPEACQQFAAKACTATSAEDIFSQNDVIFMSLPNSDIVEATMNAYFRGSAYDKIIVDLSTSYPLSTKILYQKVKKLGGTFIDAPLLGGPEDTKRGCAPCIVAGDWKDVEKVMPLLRCYAAPVDYVGQSGNGHIIKLAMNFTGLSYAVIEAQMFVLMQKLGIDQENLFHIMNGEIFGNWVFNFYGEKIISRNYHMDFALELGLKDLSYFKKIYDAYGVPAFALDGVVDLLRNSVKDGRGKHDFSEVAETLYEYFGL